MKAKDFALHGLVQAWPNSGVGCLFARGIAIQCTF